MIKEAFIRKQVERSTRDRRTSPFLRRLVFSVVHVAARDRYAAAYCMRCFQCSAAIAMLLNKLGIRTGMIAGAFCVVEVFDDARNLRWGGFWDRDHHVWAMTGFGEVVDLSVSQLHHHPAAVRNDAFPTPAIWWTDAGVMPPIFRYLPDTPVHSLADPAEAFDLLQFEAQVTAQFEQTLATNDVAEVMFAPVLDGMKTLQSMKDSDDPWANKAFAVQKAGLQFPPWIAAREDELMECWRAKRSAPSRLMQNGNFLAEADGKRQFPPT